MFHQHLDERLRIRLGFDRPHVAQFGVQHTGPFADNGIELRRIRRIAVQMVADVRHTFRRTVEDELRTTLNPTSVTVKTVNVNQNIHLRPPGPAG